MTATTRLFAADRRIACIDYAPDDMMRWLEADGWELLVPTRGEPPRMGAMLQSAVAQSRTRFVWTIEHDAEPLPGVRTILSSRLDRFPEFAGIDAMTVDAKWRPNYPNCKKPITGSYSGVGVLKCFSSLNCAIWRREALAQLDWRTIPVFPATDQHISRQLQRKGWKLGLSKDVLCVHHFCMARRHVDRRWQRA
jgi:hypothetical protein